MKKIHYIFISFLLILIFVLLFIIFGILKKPNSNNFKSNISKEKTLSEYKSIFDNSFKFYENTVNSLPKYGYFNFDFGLSIDGNLTQINNINGLCKLDSDFKSLIVSLIGQYDFNEINKLFLELSFRLFYNQLISDKGTVDIKFDLKSGKDIVYVINNFDKSILNLICVDSNISSYFIDYFNSNLNVTNNLTGTADLLDNLYLQLASTSLESTLYQNTKQQEELIINSFVDNEVIKIIGGDSLDNGVDRVKFNFDSDSFINFMNDVAKILGGGNENKNFDSDRDFFQKIIINGYFDIKNSILVDSNVWIEFPIEYKENDTGLLKYEIIVNEMKLKILDPTKLDFDLIYRITTKSNINNSLIFNIKGKIK